MPDFLSKINFIHNFFVLHHISERSAQAHDTYNKNAESSAQSLNTHICYRKICSNFLNISLFLSNIGRITRQIHVPGKNGAVSP